MNTLSLFSHINDRLMGPSNPKLGKQFEIVQKLIKEMNLQSYQDLDKNKSNRKIMEIEKELDESLGLEVQSERDFEDIDRTVFLDFLESLRLAEFFNDVVGAKETVKSTLDLKRFKKFQVSQLNKENILATYQQLANDLKLDKVERDRIEASVKLAEQEVKTKIRFVENLTQRFFSQGLDSKKVFSCLKKVFPKAPILESELEIVITKSAIFFCIDSLETIEKTKEFHKRNEQEQEKLKVFLNQIDQFNFQQFYNFPVFSNYNGNEANKEFINQLASELNQTSDEAISGLTSTISFIKKENIDLYLIHDTWGHMWQGQLLNVKYFYQKMTKIKRSLFPEMFIQISESDQFDTIVSMSDLFYLTIDGQLSYDRSLGQKFIYQILKDKIDTVLVPIVAELCADLMEYKFNFDNQDSNVSLPTTSIFKGRPTKYDFAWLDLSVMTRIITKDYPNKKDAFIKDFAKKLEVILREKYRPQIQMANKGKETFKNLPDLVSRFIEDFESLKDRHLNINQDDCKQNDLFKLFMNLVYVVKSINLLFGKLQENQYSSLKQYWEVIIIYLLKSMERNPTQSFWHLDENIAENCIPILQLFAQSSESEDK